MNAHEIIDRLVWWVGVAVTVGGGVFAGLFVWYWALEYAIRIFKLKGLLLGLVVARLKARQGIVTTKKPGLV